MTSLGIGGESGYRFPYLLMLVWLLSAERTRHVSLAASPPSVRASIRYQTERDVAERPDDDACPEHNISQ